MPPIPPADLIVLIMPTIAPVVRALPSRPIDPVILSMTSRIFVPASTIAPISPRFTKFCQIPVPVSLNLLILNSSESMMIAISRSASPALFAISVIAFLAASKFWIIARPILALFLPNSFSIRVCLVLASSSSQISEIPSK